MKEKLKSVLSIMFGCFIVINVLMVWLQGGGRYRNNSHVSLKPGLVIGIPVALIIGVLSAIQEFKKK